MVCLCFAQSGFFFHQFPYATKEAFVISEEAITSFSTPEAAKNIFSNIAESSPLSYGVVTYRLPKGLRLALHINKGNTAKLTVFLPLITIPHGNNKKGLM